MHASSSQDRPAPEEPLRIALVGPGGADRDRLRARLADRGHTVEVFGGGAALRAALTAGMAFDGVLCHGPVPAPSPLDDAPSGGPPVLALARESGEGALDAALDVFERLRRLERMLGARRRAEDEAAEVLVHDLRNPLEAIVQLAESISRGELLSPQGRVDLEGLVGAARGAARRLEGLRRPKIADSDTAPAIGPAAEIGLRELVADALRHAGLPPGIVRWDPEDADLVVRADPVGLRRVIEHVFANARIHAGGAVAVGIRATGDRIRVEVTDDGPGLPSGGPRRRRLLEGVGLRYCRQVIEAHGGRLSVASPAGGGLTVRMSWPGFVRARPLSAVPTPPSESTAGLRVWLVDDDASVRRSIGRLLEQLGHSARTFEDGPELLAALADGGRPPDVVLCDQGLPGIPGLTVLRRVRTLAPGAARVLYTARPPDAAVIEAFNQGAVHRFIRKDEGPAAIEVSMQALLAERRAQGRATVAPAREPVRADLETLLAESKVELHVQPLFEAGSRRLVACEALMRSRHPTFKGPLEIIDAARVYERELALQQVLSRLSRDLRDRLPPELDLLVNIDPALLRSPRHLDEGLADLYPVAAGVVLELTERARLGSDMAWEAAVRRLREVGFRVALDDVGAGYNSLGAVAAVKPEVIKLDISLISGVHRDPRRAELVRLLCDYARRHDIGTVAEGIEEAEEAAVCAELGVRWLQGYHLARPMPLDALAARHGVPLRR